MDPEKVRQAFEKLAEEESFVIGKYLIGKLGSGYAHPSATEALRWFAAGVAFAQSAAPTQPDLSRHIKHMVERFLQWRLPENFNPDCGISFKKTFNERTAHPMKHEPVGTNLLDYGQAEEMVRYMLDSLPGESAAPQAERPAATPEDDDLISVVASLRKALESYDGCTEEDCGCPGSVLFAAVRECEKQYRSIPSATRKIAHLAESEREAQPLPIAALREWLKAMADAEYSSYIGQMKHPAALGWEAKCKAGEFGDKELTAHTMAGTYLGHHQALMRVLRKLDQLEPLPAVPEARREMIVSTIFEEMLERDWSLSDIAIRMGGTTEKEIQIDQLALHMYLVVANENVRLGIESARKLSKAFDMSEDFFINLESGSQPAQAGDGSLGYEPCGIDYHDNWLFHPCTRPKGHAGMHGQELKAGDGSAPVSRTKEGL